MRYETRGDSLLGVNLFDALGFNIVGPNERDPANVGPVNTPLCSLVINSLSMVSWADYPVLCKQSGVLTGFHDEPTVDPSVRPKRQPLRRSALALRDPVSAEIKRM